MFKSNHLSRIEIKKTLKNGERFSVKGVTAIFLPSNEKLGIVVIVSKKVSPSSVNRNKIKRKFREAFRLIIKDKENIKGNLILICHLPKYSFRESVWCLRKIISFISKKKNGHFHKPLS
ncbi:MAG: ribonuclease P protein component [Patescibacteria group bacterium]|nr:ribonuclease P protein component [Patescibacteria group bacterium]